MRSTARSPKSVGNVLTRTSSRSVAVENPPFLRERNFVGQQPREDFQPGHQFGATSLGNWPSGCNTPSSRQRTSSASPSDRDDVAGSASRGEPQQPVHEFGGELGSWVHTLLSSVTCQGRR